MLVAESLTGALAGLENNGVIRTLIMAQKKKTMYNTYLDIESLNALIGDMHRQRPFVLT